MKNTIPEVDAYIENAEKFAQPILKKIRRLFHKACPDIAEAMKWKMPSFEHKGIVAVVAGFKKHVRLSFWKGQLMKDPQELFEDVGDSDMKALILKDAKELPADDVLLLYIKQAVELNERGKKSPHKRKTKKPAPAVPDYFLAAMKKNKKALATFEDFSPSHQREYVEWITEAKRKETREKRIVQAIEWMSEGKPRNWKYMKKK